MEFRTHLLCERTGLHHTLNFVINKDKEILVLNNDNKIIARLSCDSMNNGDYPIGKDSFFLMFEPEDEPALDKNIATSSE
jgi:hypothetical protein